MIFRKTCLTAILQFLFPPLFLLSSGGVVYFLYPMYGPIEPETANERQLLTWIYIRDLPREKNPAACGILHRLEELYGRGSGFEPVFSFTEEQKCSTNEIFPDLGMIPPGECSRIRSAPSLTERNIRYLVKLWLFERMKTFEYAETCGKEAKDDFMNGISLEIDWWNDLCFKFMIAAELRIPTLLEIIGIVDDFVADIGLDCSQDEAVRLDRFYKELKSAYTSRMLMKFFN